MTKINILQYEKLFLMYKQKTLQIDGFFQQFLNIDYQYCVQDFPTVSRSANENLRGWNIFSPNLLIVGLASNNKSAPLATKSRHIKQEALTIYLMWWLQNKTVHFSYLWPFSLLYCVFLILYIIWTLWYCFKSRPGKLFIENKWMTSSTIAIKMELKTRL